MKLFNKMMLLSVIFTTGISHLYGSQAPQRVASEFEHALNLIPSPPLAEIEQEFSYMVTDLEEWYKSFKHYLISDRDITYDNGIIEHGPLGKLEVPSSVIINSGLQEPGLMYFSDTLSSPYKLYAAARYYWFMEQINFLRAKYFKAKYEESLRGVSGGHGGPIVKD